MQVGYITAKAYSSRAEIPVVGAVFTVVSTDDNPELLGIRFTDENGKTPVITVNAPDENLSTVPGNKNPYTSVNVRIDHPYYNTYQVTGVQIFAGQVSLVNAEMIPTESHISYNNKANVFDVDSQNLL